jgi:uncharacterized protein (DUF2336 family)
MGDTLSLIPELEDAVQRGSRAKRREILQRMTALFVDGAGHYNDAHVDLFDDVFSLLIEEIESKARAELSQHLAPLTNAPVKVLRTLANDDDITVAEPVLKLSPRLAETDLVNIASTKGQEHLRAISERRALGEAVTDVLVRRGDREVARSVAENRGARISQKSFSNLVKRAEDDGILAEKVASRPDIPISMFRALLEKATAVVHDRLIASATPEMRAAIGDVLAKVSKEVGARVGPRDYRAAQRVVLGLGQANRLNETTLLGFCGERKFEEAVVTLAALAKIQIEIVDRLMDNDRFDPVLILCKAANLSWPAVKAVIMLRSVANGMSAFGLDAALTNYGRLSAATRRALLAGAPGQWRLKRRSHPPENQETGRALLARGLGVIAGAGEIRPAFAPVVGALRGPGEIRRLDEMPQCPCSIVGDVGHEANIAAAPQDAGELRDSRVLNETPLPMPPLWPWIGMDQIDARQRRVRQPGEQRDGVVEMQSDIAQPRRLDGAERLGHAIDEGLDADNSGARPRDRLSDHVFAAAEADLELNFINRHRE